MALLSLFPNETQKNQEIQNQQTYVALQSIQKWSNVILTQQDVDYEQTNTSNNAQSNDFSTSSTNFVTLPNLTFNFTPKNTLCDVSFNLTLKGKGSVAIIVNGQLLTQIPFDFATFSQLVFVKKIRFSLSNNKINLAIKATTGSVILACSKSTPCYNNMQIIDLNS
jgi:hypothetical protein